VSHGDPPCRALRPMCPLDKQVGDEVSVNDGILDPECDVHRHREDRRGARRVDLSAHLDDAKALDVVDGGGGPGQHGLDRVLDRAVGLSREPDGLGDGGHLCSLRSRYLVLGTWYLVLGTRRGYRSRDQVGVWTRFRLSPAQYSVPTTRYIPIWSNRCSVTHCVDTDLLAVSSSRRTVGNYARLVLGSGCERLMRMRRPFRLLVVGLAVLIGLAGCGGPGASADLLRTTAEGIDISMSASEEVLPLPGCRTQWLMNHDEEPPPGTCEKTVTVRRFEAHHGGTTVETSVVGEPNVDPLYAMGLASKNSAAGLSVFVVIPPSEAVAVRLMDAQGDVVDELA